MKYSGLSSVKLGQPQVLSSLGTASSMAAPQSPTR